MTSNFYHKQAPAPANRRDRALTIDAGARRRRDKFNPDAKPEQQVRHSIKMLAIVVVSMLALMLFSIRAVEFMWGRRDRAVLGSTPSAPPALPPPAVLSTGRVPMVIAPAIAASTSETTAVLAPPPTVDRKEIDRIYRWGKVLEDAGEWEGALARYQEALIIDSTDTAILSQIGRLNIRIARYADAIKALEQAHRFNPDQPDIMNDLGVAMTFHGQAPEAIALFAELQAKHPDYVPALFNKGYAHVQIREFDQARPLLEDYLGKKPDDAMALGVLAVVEMAEKRYEAALALLNRAIASNPEWPTPYLDAATVCAIQGDTAQSLSYLEKALQYGTPAEVYRTYQAQVFQDVRLSDAGKDFERNIAEKARQLIR